MGILALLKPAAATSVRPDLTVLVMGETGTGKSSVVNLLVGTRVAKISPDAKPCTLKTVKYEATIRGRGAQMSVHIWEVRGFNQPVERPRNNSETAFDMDLDLILQANASVDVILFCARGPRLKVTTTGIFQSVNRVFGEHVTIVPVITSLELETNMEGWWERNSVQVNRILVGLRGTEHACITGLQGGRYEAKSAASRASLVSTLEGRHSPRQRSVSLEFILREDVRRNGGQDKMNYAKKRFMLRSNAAARRLV
ncbi:hypothetical protein EDD16DRAFT_1539175 [Pisolithus croceorrhizus]|nr:hypothetical protein EDD16DRAFT_1539175 [Pisolithus croceorrhizus]